MRQALRDWCLAFRPKTLTAALVPIFVATALVQQETGVISVWISILALLSALCIQIGTNLFNDALDFKKGADTAQRVGPKRATQSGMFTYQQVIRAALLFFLFATLFAVPLIAHGGWPILAIGVVSLVMGYAYTGGPFPLAYKGLGDLFVIFFFGIIAVSGVYYLQTLQWSGAAVIAGLQIGLMSTVLIVINNLRDVEQDKKVDKKTLAVRFGSVFCLAEIGVLYYFSFALGLYWYLRGYWHAFVLPLALFPLSALFVFQIIKNHSGEVCNRYLGQAAALHFFFGILLAIAFVWK